MKVIGLDLGSRTLGIAISDKYQMLASPVEIFRFRDDDYNSAKDYVLKLAKEFNTNKIVLGYPKNMNNTIGERAEISEMFKSMLEEYNLEVVLWDERLSTKEVTRMMISADLSRKKRKQQVDKLAATVILQGYLNSK
ncbi:Holliday junction resolvase RuvX [Mycoplasmatota bacterium]|nr:Holliday junction resolvase RuvX [Mycoplasmatota bacterium]